MTATEVLDSLSSTLISDDRILSMREKELIATLLQRAKTDTGTRNHAVAETIARAVGEVIAQRAYGILGNTVSERLVDEFTGSVSLRGSPHPPSPGPGSPSPPGPPAGNRHQADESSALSAHGSPHPPSPSPPGPGRNGHRIEARGSPHPPSPGPGAPSPGAPSPAAREHRSVAILETPGVLLAQCAVLEEFLAPAELEELMSYTLEHETDFEVSEVISPGVTGGSVDFEHRRSRVLLNMEPRRQDVIVDRIQSCLPRILRQLGHEPFRISRVEAQITASNDGDYFRWHSDNAHPEIASRELTFVYFFHREPKQFRGGELRLYDSRWKGDGYQPTPNYRTIVPQQNQAVFFDSSLTHEITPVECSSRAFADSRFTVNGWFHR